MCDLRLWTKDFVLEFIELYRSFPSVWKVKSAEYRNRIKKNEAYEVLMKKCKEVDENATVKSVKQKIDSLRGAFRKELKKVKDSSKSGAGSESLYKPHLWYFDHLLFLTDHESTRTGVGNIEDDDEDASEARDLCNAEVSIENSLGENLNVEGSISIIPQEPKTRPGFNRKRKPDDDLTTEVLATVRDHFKTPMAQPDRYDIFGKSVALKLRNLDKRQALIAEKKITDILFVAEMESLNESNYSLSASSNITLYAQTPSQIYTNGSFTETDKSGQSSYSEDG